MKILESIDDASNIETSSGVIKPAWGKRNVDVSSIRFHCIKCTTSLTILITPVSKYQDDLEYSKRFLNAMSNLYIIESPLFLKILKIPKNDI